MMKISRERLASRMAGWVMWTAVCLPLWAAPLYESDFLFEANERYPESHGSTITVLPSGDLLAAWYAGSAEKAPDVAILGVRRSPKDQQWSAPFVLTDDPTRSDGNPVLFVDRDQTVWLFYNVMYGKAEGRTRQGTGWTSCKIHYRISSDDGRTWSLPRTLTEEWGYLTRSKPIQLENGDILLPAHDERDWSSLFLIAEEGKPTWTTGQRIDCGGGFHWGNIEPTVIQRADKSLLCFMRAGGPKTHRIWQSESFDLGRTWTHPVTVSLPNPDAAVDLLKLKSGNVVLAFNNSTVERCPLTLALSNDDGKTWVNFRDLETEGGAYSYPSLTEAQDGAIHVTYTYQRKTIKHVRLNEDWILEEK
jgi:predicted neuraminidase